MKNYFLTIVYYLLSVWDSIINLVLSLFNLSGLRIDVSSGFLFKTQVSRIEKELQGRHLKRDKMQEEALNKVEEVRKDFGYAKTIHSKTPSDGRKSD